MTVVPTAIAALVGAMLFERLHVPSGAMIGAMAAVGLLNVVTTTNVPSLPNSARFLAYAALGWLIGQGVTRETASILLRSLLPITVVVLALLIFGIGLGWVLSQSAVIDPATAYLATSPGALSQMSAIAASVGADAPLVVTVHTLRVVALIFLAPLIGRLAGAT